MSIADAGVIVGTGAYECPECAEAGTPRSFTTPQGLGRHRTTVHGIAGSRARKASSRKRGRPRKQASQAAPAGAKPLDSAKLLELVNNGHALTPDRLYRLQAWLAEGEALYRGV